jgi:hypothetical protein
MVIMYKDGRGAGLSLASGFARGFIARKQQDRQDQKEEARLQIAREAAAHARQIQDEERQFVRGERERLAKGRTADAELTRLLLEEQRGSTAPTAQSSPFMASLGLIGKTLSKVFPGSPLDPEQKQTERENRKWDAFERMAPNLSQDGRKLLFAHLKQESDKKAQDAQYGALARRVGQLTMPAKSPLGSEMPGLDPEDPEQAELIANLQGMIDQRGDPDEINDAIGELEGEIKRDRLAQIKREGKLSKMEEALTGFPSFATQEELDQAHGIYLDLQADQTRDPEDAWNEFRSMLFGGKSRWQAAYEQAAKLSMATKDEFGQPAPHLPSEGEVYEVGAVLYPHDPRFRTDLQNFPESPMRREQPAARGMNGAQPGAPQPQMQEPAPTGVEDAAQGAAETAGALPSPEVRAVQAQKLTTEAMNAMAMAVDQAGSPEEADQAIAATAKQAGIPLEALPDWLLKTLATRWQAQRGADQSDRVAKLQAGERRGRATGADTTPPAPARRPPKGQLFEDPQGFKDGPIGYDAKLPEEPAEPKAAAAPPRTWKRLTADEQKAARAALTEAIEKATRFNFFGALAPTLRALGIDLGSLPKAEAKSMREKLKAQRARLHKAESQARGAK